jgi:hypothetical protein
VAAIALKEAGVMEMRIDGPPLARELAAQRRAPFEDNMSRLTSKSVLRSASVLAVLGALMVLVALTNPSATSMATAMFLVGLGMIAIASFAGL